MQRISPAFPLLVGAVDLIPLHDINCGVLLPRIGEDATFLRAFETKAFPQFLGFLILNDRFLHGCLAGIMLSPEGSGRSPLLSASGPTLEGYSPCTASILK